MSDTDEAASPAPVCPSTLLGSLKGARGRLGPPSGAPHRWGWERGDVGEEGSPSHPQAQLFSAGKPLPIVLCYRPPLKRATLTAPRGPLKDPHHLVEAQRFGKVSRELCWDWPVHLSSNLLCSLEALVRPPTPCMEVLPSYPLEPSAWPGILSL